VAFWQLPLAPVLRESAVQRDAVVELMYTFAHGNTEGPSFGKGRNTYSELRALLTMSMGRSSVGEALPPDNQWNRRQSAMAISEDDTPRLQRSYRPDIDGLRCVAVVAVILNHFDRAALPLGYLGVDIFFVISGFVITSSIYHRAGVGLFRFWSAFYARRFKRLFPALAACVLITSILICFVDPAPAASLRTGLSALVGLSNMYLLKQATDYFGTWADLNAFTHTWSLGVEEQFYLVFPLAVWATGVRRTPSRAPGAFIAAVTISSVASLMFYIFISSKNQPMAFFLLPSRLWELGVGVLLFSFSPAEPQILRLAQKMPSGLLLAGLVVLFFLPAEAEVPTTIAAVALTAALIASLRPAALAYRLLTLPTMLYLGKISYSLYLWHWSVICLSRWTFGLYWWLAPLQFGLMLALAAASFYALEAPLRRTQWSHSQLRSFFYGLASVLSIVVTMVLLLGSGHTHFYLGTTVVDATFKPRIVTSPKGTLLLIGDSHAGQFTRLAEDISASFGLRHIVISNGATPFPPILFSTPVGGLTFEKNRSAEASMQRDVQRAVAGLNPHETNIIILSSFYSFYFEPLRGERRYQVMTHYDATGQTITVEQSLDNWLDALKAFAFQNRRSHIVIILSTPEMGYIYPLALCQIEWFRPHLSDQCNIQVDRQGTVALLAKLNSRIIQAVAGSPNVSIFDPMPAICPKAEAVCRSDDGDGRLFADEDHLTAIGVRRVEVALSDFLVKNGLVP
jgi:peptidoglycan/LPS O-acetylase OafA/YrhL